MAKAMNWDHVNKHAKARSQTSPKTVTIIPDESFWRCWKDDPDAMRESGYRVRKTKNGWRVSFEMPTVH